MSSALVTRARAVLDQEWTKNSRLGLRLIVAATIVTIVIAFMGPSAVALRLGPRSSLMPPWYLPAGIVSLNEWVAVLSLWLALGAGSIGTSELLVRAQATGALPRLECPGMLIDIERGPIRLGRAEELAVGLQLEYQHIDKL